MEPVLIETWCSPDGKLELTREWYCDVPGENTLFTVLYDEWPSEDLQRVFEVKIINEDDEERATGKMLEFAS